MYEFAKYELMLLVPPGPPANATLGRLACSHSFYLIFDSSSPPIYFPLSLPPPPPPLLLLLLPLYRDIVIVSFFTFYIFARFVLYSICVRTHLHTVLTFGYIIYIIFTYIIYISPSVNLDSHTLGQHAGAHTLYYHTTITVLSHLRIIEFYYFFFLALYLGLSHWTHRKNRK